MDIPTLKRHLTVTDVAVALGIKPDRHGKALCPFHEDKTPSLQLSNEKGIATCFSSRCTAGTMDIIDLAKRSRNLNTHEAILWLKELAGLPAEAIAKAGLSENGKGNLSSFNRNPSPASVSSPANGTEQLTLSAEQSGKIALLTKIWHYFTSGLTHSQPAMQYLESRKLDHNKIEVGYNNGVFHRGQTPEFLETAVKCGLLKPNSTGGYHVFGKDSIVFALRNSQNQITGLYFRSIRQSGEKAERHFYLKNREGLYPHYPKPGTKVLLLTEAIIDCATVMQYDGLLQIPGLSFLALYGTNGLTDEHRRAIKEMKELKEVILFFDGDEAGKAAVVKYTGELAKLNANLIISSVNTPEKEDVNSIAQSHQVDIFAYLLSSRELLYPSKEEKSSRPPSVSPQRGEGGLLLTTNPEHIIYKTSDLIFILLGGLPLNQLDRMRVTLKTQYAGGSGQSIRHTLDLYNDDQVERYIRKAAEKLEISTSQLQKSIAELIDLLEQHRLHHIEQKKVRDPQKRELTEQRAAAARTYLKNKELMERTGQDLGKAGIIGEEANRFIAYLAFTSRKTFRPVHVICLGASGTGKTYLLEKIAELIPEQDKVEITASSDNAFYYFEKEELKHKVVIVEDVQGVHAILFPLRELQTKMRIRKVIPFKDNKGNLRTMLLEVEGPICLACTTTREKLYEDNANRCLLLYLDNSEKQQEKIMEFQRKLSAGKINRREQQELKEFFKDVQSVLRPVAVRNPYAEFLQIPPHCFKPLRTNDHYLAFIEAITFYHQYQRPVKTDPETGEKYIETTLEDIAWANELLKEVLLAKSDELPQAFRHFFEGLKYHVRSNGKQSFYAKEIRGKLRMNPMAVNRYLRELEARSYIRQTGGNRKSGYEYEIVLWQDYEQLKKETNILDDLLKKIKEAEAKIGKGSAE